MKDEQFDVLMWKLEEIRTGIIDIEIEFQEIKEVLSKKNNGVFIGDKGSDLSDLHGINNGIYMDELKNKKE